MSDHIEALKLILESADTPLLTGVLKALRDGWPIDLEEVLSEILTDRQKRELELKNVKPQQFWSDFGKGKSE